MKKRSLLITVAALVLMLALPQGAFAVSGNGNSQLNAAQVWFKCLSGNEASCSAQDLLNRLPNNGTGNLSDYISIAKELKQNGCGGDLSSLLECIKQSQCGSNGNNGSNGNDPDSGDQNGGNDQDHDNDQGGDILPPDNGGDDIITPPEYPDQTPDNNGGSGDQNGDNDQGGNTDQDTNSGAYKYAKEILNLVNAERAKAGVSPLTLNNDLSRSATLKSEDMAKNNYFSHTSPTYGSPFQMMQSLGISYSYAGENIAMGQKSPEAVMDAWMNSQGHRENILSSNFTQLGVGYAANGSGTPYWTQQFIRP